MKFTVLSLLSSNPNKLVSRSLIFAYTLLMTNLLETQAQSQSILKESVKLKIQKRGTSTTSNSAWWDPWDTTTTRRSNTLSVKETVASTTQSQSWTVLKTFTLNPQASTDPLNHNNNNTHTVPSTTTTTTRKLNTRKKDAERSNSQETGINQLTYLVYLELRSKLKLFFVTELV